MSCLPKLPPKTPYPGQSFYLTAAEELWGIFASGNAVASAPPPGRFPGLFAE
jgi:hypothetical protein